MSKLLKVVEGRIESGAEPRATFVVIRDLLMEAEGVDIGQPAEEPAAEPSEEPEEGPEEEPES